MASVLNAVLCDGIMAKKTIPPMQQSPPNAINTMRAAERESRMKAMTKKEN